MKCDAKKLIVFFTLALLAACGSTPTENIAAKPKTSEELCSAIVKDINTGLTERILANMDMPKFVDAALKGQNTLSDAEKANAANALSKELLTVLNTFSRLSDSWQMVQFKNAKSRTHCIIRGDVEDGGTSYVDFQISTDNDRVNIVDWYSHSNAVLASEAFGQIMIDLAKIYKNQDQKTKDQERFLQYIDAIRKNDYAKAIEVYPKLSDKYQHNYVYALRYLEAIEAHHPKQLQAKTKELILKFGKQRYYGLLLFDYYYEAEAFDQLNLQIDKAIERIGEDDWLFMLKAVSAQQLKDDKLFYQNILNGLNVDPGYDTPYWMLLKHLAKQGKYSDALLVLDVLKLGFSYQFTESSLSDQEEFGDIAKSKAYQQWLNEQYK